MDINDMNKDWFFEIVKKAFEMFYGKNVSDDLVRVTEGELSSDDKRDTGYEWKGIFWQNMNSWLKIGIKRDSRYACLFECILVDSLLKTRLPVINLEKDSKDYFTTKYAEESYLDASRKFEEFLKKELSINLRIVEDISASYYEGEEAEGDIFFMFQEPSEDAIVLMDSAVEFHQDRVRKIRKLLEITRSDTDEKRLMLAFQYRDEKWNFYGMVNQDAVHSGVRIHFVKHMVWDMYLNGSLVVGHRCGHYALENRSEELEFQKKIAGMQSETKSEIDVVNVWEKSVKNVRRQKHGAILIIFFEDGKVIKNEVERLVKYSSGNQVQKKEKEDRDDYQYIKRISAIDGAVIVDANGDIYGFGIILDAEPELNIQQDSGRGARFNSARRYIASKAKNGLKAMAVIVSEDGTVDFYTNAEASEEMTLCLEDNGNEVE